ncbi:MAG: von Willebrand factor type A domain-containing protein [Bacteroidia bacterium]
MKQIAILVFTLLLSLSISAQEIVKGKVIDANAYSPIVGATIMVKNTSRGSITDNTGQFSIQAALYDTLVVSFLGYKRQEYIITSNKSIIIPMQSDQATLEEVVVTGYGSTRKENISNSVPIRANESRAPAKARKKIYRGAADGLQKDKTRPEGYNQINENGDLETKDSPISTLSIDVDKAAYANVRRYLINQQQPPKDAVRIEELINYFPYAYDAPSPDNKHPFAVQTEITECPWNSERQLLHVAIQGQRIPKQESPGSNLVFLIDVSGSMESPNKLPLLRESFSLLADQLSEADKVSIVVYAGAAGVVLSPTAGNDKTTIKAALNSLNAGGSTAGGAGIERAYQLAEENFITNGNNRIILATDGDFNVGLSDQNSLVKLIEEKRKSGIFLTVLGFGTGNYQDGQMEQIADHGNGNYFYIDGQREARKVLRDELSGTLFTIAKDVKIQIEFNPGKVKSYRLIGYENRLLEEKDFEDDKKDAGELGSGHSVTALYEIVPQTDPSVARKRKDGETLAYVRLRYKQPKETKSILMETEINARIYPLEKCSEAFQLSCIVAEFGLLLRDSEHKAEASYNSIIPRLESLQEADLKADRDELLQLIVNAAVLEEAALEK